MSVPIENAPQNDAMITSGTIACAAFSVDQNQVIYRKGPADYREYSGLGIPLLLHRVLKMVNKGYVNFSDVITVDKHVALNNSGTYSLGLEEGEKITLISAFSALVACGAPDAAVALSRHLSQATKIKTLSSLKRTAEKIGLNEHSVKTVSGRCYSEEQTQYFTIDELMIISRALLPFDANRMLQINAMAYEEKLIKTDCVLGSYGKVTNFLCFGEDNKNCMAMAEVNGETIHIVAMGAKTPFERDSAILNAIYFCEKGKTEPVKDTWIPVQDCTLTVCGDTYFGEWYTVNRIKNGINDPMQQMDFSDEAYGFSLQKLMPFLPDTSYNVVNYEAVLTPQFSEGSQTCGYTDFSLGGDPGKSVSAIKSANIQGVLLANNHMMDYGAAGCRQTIDAFQSQGIKTIGAGRNCNDAETPICLTLGGKKVILFNAYWYMTRRHQILKYYAAGGNTGLSCLGNFHESTFLEKVSVYRKEYPDAFIILAAHWGFDFSNDLNYSRTLARKAIKHGIDLIIGAGPHMVLGCELISNSQGVQKPVLYSVGHFVFNTTGRDFDENGVLPYGLISKVVWTGEGLFLRLYPIYVNNRATFWQPHGVSDEQMREFVTHFPMGIKFSEVQKDTMGYYIERKLEV